MFRINLPEDMRAVVQRVTKANVAIDGDIVGEIGHGLLVLLGVQTGDTDADAQWLAGKVARLRIFPDEASQMNRSVVDVAGGILVVSQFTLIADTHKGTRPSFNSAAKPETAVPLYELFVRHASGGLGQPVQTGKFGALMAVSLVNDGPVTLVIDSQQRD